MTAIPDLGALKFRQNPAAFRLKKSVTIELPDDVVKYFKGMADEPGA